MFLRLYEKEILPVVLNTTYHIRYWMPDAQHLTVVSRATRIAEVKDPDKSLTEEMTPGEDSGFLWRLNSYWQFTAADGGVYAFGTVPFLGSLPALGTHVDDIVGIASTPNGGGYWEVASDGGLFAFGNAGFVGSMGG